MKLRFSTVLIVILLTLLSLLSLTMYAADEITVFYNGSRIEFDVNPMLIDGRTMVPMRAIFEAFGARVEYNSQTQQISGIKDDLYVVLHIGSKNAYVFKKDIQNEYTLDTAPTILFERTLVPLRFIGESLGATVLWNGQTRTITIDSAVKSSIETVARTQTLTATEIAKHMAPRSVFLSGYDSSNNLINTGSGFFIDAFGHIATNFHVIEDAVKIEATLNDGQIYTTGNVVHIDRKRDLAVLSINRMDTPFVAFGNSTLVEAGDTIYTYGNPRGITNMISDGIVSNKNVVVDEYSYIFVTAPISPGSSGGCLVDDKGNVVGITTIVMNDAQNINGAIPINDLKLLLNQSQLIYKTIDYSNGVYKGYTLNDIRHYKGTYIWTEGGKYEGDWDMGEQNGFGTYNWSGSEGYKQYTGYWTDGELNGVGEMSWYNGNVYIGDWVMGEMSGQGKLIFGTADLVGHIYEGGFLNGLFQGIGTFAYPDGSKTICVWENGNLVSSTPSASGQIANPTPTPTPPQLDLAYRNSLLSRTSNIIVAAEDLKLDYKAYLENLNARGLYSSGMGDQAREVLETIKTDLASLNTLYDLILNVTTNNELYEYETTLITFETAYK